jgi:FkbM family methyltransferase
MSIRENLKSLVGSMPALSIYLRKRKQRLAHNRAPVTTAHGFRFTGNPLMESGAFETAETQIFRTLLPAFEQFINVGANIGFYCCHALQLRVPTVAFEPSPGNVELLLENVALNGWDDQIEVFPLALSEAPGVLKFYGDGTGASLIPGWAGVPQSYVSRVPVSTLDLVLGQRFLGKPTLFLVDVEGAELSMLEGAAAHLDGSQQSVWMIEICISEHIPGGEKVNPQLLKTFDLFWSRGCSAYTADGTARLVTREMIEMVACSGIDNIGTHNFIFFWTTPPAELLAALTAC